MESFNLNLKAGLQLLQSQYLNDQITEANNTMAVISVWLLSGIENAMHNWTGKEQKYNSIDLFPFTILSVSVTYPTNIILTIASRYKTISEVEFYCCSQQRYIRALLSWVDGVWCRCVPV
jgi:hypothetical protein